MENKIERKLVEKVNQIKFSLLIFLTLSLYMVGFFAVIGIVILLIVSYIIGGYIAKGFENFKIKEEFCLNTKESSSNSNTKFSPSPLLTT
ncbi:hypothetical protein HOK00_04680 [bacterium]|nr:hypothetical protein [bacterium]